MLKKVKGYNYNVDCFGNVTNTITGQVLKGFIDKYGYRHYVLYNESGRLHFTEHRLVATYFIPNRNKLKNEVNHKDGNKLNNHVSNLEWVTSEKNRQHAVKNKLHAYGERNGGAKLTQVEVDQIKLILQAGKCNQSELGRRF